MLVTATFIYVYLMQVSIFYSLLIHIVTNKYILVYIYISVRKERKRRGTFL